MSLPHRYELAEQPDDRSGYRVFTFFAHGTTWQITQVDRPNDQRSILSCKSAVPYWPTHALLALDGTISPAAFVDILSRVFEVASHAHGAGYAKRGADIREALGI